MPTGSPRDADQPKLDMDSGIEEDEVNPLAQLMFDFFTEPKSSKFGYYWGVFVAWLVAVQVLAVGLESCDGPNQYEGRENLASYSFLLSSNGYWAVTLVTQLPLVIDALGRVILIVFIVILPENKRLVSELWNDSFKRNLIICDFLGIFPFFVEAVYTRPNNAILNSSTSLTLQLMQLLSTCRIVRITKEIPAVWAIRITLSKSAEHLFLPFFVFFIANVTAAVIFYFIEPCYNKTKCPWHDLFEATFYSVVTMTTTGYGNQTPQYALLRFVACFVMVFGAVFMSMPLAIIGNEYSDAWHEVTTDLQAAKEKQLQRDAARVKEMFAGAVKMLPVGAVTAVVDKLKQEQSVKQAVEQAMNGGSSSPRSPRVNILGGGNMKVVEMMDDRVKDEYSQILERSAMIESHKKINELLLKLDHEQKICQRLTPMLLMYLTELRGWICSLAVGSRFTIDQLTKDLQPVVDKKGRRGSAFLHHDPAKEAQKVIDEEEEELAAAQARAGRLQEEEEEADPEHVSLYTLVWEMIVGQRATRHETEHSIMMMKYEKDPGNFRNRMWLLLEIHDSSREARGLQILVLILILLSVLLLFSETLPSWNKWGEESHLCGAVLNKYCHNKHSNILDPGCFVFNSAGEVTEDKMRFLCSDSDCFGHGYNFGSTMSNLSCSDEIEDYPFQSSTTLYYTYGSPTMFTSRPQMHRISAPCMRMECNPMSDQSFDGESFFYRGEIIITTLFTIELLMRVAVADSVVRYLSDSMNIFDLLSILPFYVEIAGVTKDLGSQSNNFGIIASSPENYLLVLARSFKVFRLFKLIRHFKQSKVFTDTARKAYSQLLGILSFMIFLVILFAIMFYEVESGTPCYVGDVGCVPPDSIKDIVRDGDRILINKLGQVSQFPDVFYGLWFSFVTLTTTGYGDIVPVTNTGQIMTVFLMLAGSCYLSMPLTVASSTFYDVHQIYSKKREAKVMKETAMQRANQLAAKAAKDMAWKRRLQQIKVSLNMAQDRVETLLSDLQRPYTEDDKREDEHALGNSSLFGSKKSALLLRTIGITNSVRTSMASIGKDLEILVLSAATNAQTIMTNSGAGPSSGNGSGASGGGATAYLVN